MFLDRLKTLRTLPGLIPVVLGVSLIVATPYGAEAAGKAKDDKSSSEEQGKKEDPKEKLKGRDPIPVSFELARTQDVSDVITYSGRVEAIESVEIFARVQGYLHSRNFEEGQKVQAGDLLFKLDDELYANAVAQNEAALKSAQAQEVLATQTFNRQKELTARDVQSQARLDDATANLDSARAGVQAAQAQLDAAKINLGYTTISAPISGLVGRALVSKGDLISPESGALVTLVSQDPMYVSFPVPQKQVLEFQRRAKNDGSADDLYKIQLKLPDGSLYQHEAKFQFANNQTTASTDSLLVRVIVPNPEGMLIDQTLLDVSVTSREGIESLTIPETALLLDQGGAYVFIVDADNTAKKARIETGAQRDGFIVVNSGLKEGDKVIVDGLQKLQPGIPVDAQAESDQS